MQKLANFTEVNSFLATVLQKTLSRNKTYSLDTMRQLMAYFGNPQNSYQVVHVAGTSGKSSTCHYLSAMLTASGAKVGLSVSPHVYQINERVQINTQPLSEQIFCSEFSIFVSEVSVLDIVPTYFEMLIAFAFWEFARQNVDYAVIEVGLGGLLDCTNIISRPNKICVMTDMDLDHTEVLGPRIEDVAKQKAGIILPRNVIFMHRQNSEIMQVVDEVTAEKQAKLHVIDSLQNTDLWSELPVYQYRNWSLAYEVYKYIAQRDSLSKLGRKSKKATARVFVPARMERVHYRGKTIILDGAHNPQKLSALARSMQNAFPGKKVACMVSFVQSKQSKIDENLSILLPIVSRLVATDFSKINNVRAAIDPRVIQKHCNDLGYDRAEVCSNPRTAFAKLMGREEDIILIVGSFFLPETVRHLMMEE
ncbi:hypothetical protein KC968_04190 [Candidatus Saccharibacteria bacterium]|nr:hypothetical protein [Candidatus Saccharibacteria bacterium]